LRPDGLLVNIQPLDKSMSLEVRVGSGCRRRAGLAFDDDEAQEDMTSSYATLSALAAEGLFTAQAESVYLLKYHFHVADDWQEFLARPKAGDVEADTDLLASTIAHPDGSIIASELTTITTYNRSS